MIFLVVMEAEVAATDIYVLGFEPNTLPATALIPNWKPMVGLAAIFGTTVMADLLRSESSVLFGCSTSLIMSPISYCLFKFSLGDFSIGLAWTPEREVSPGALSWL